MVELITQSLSHYYGLDWLALVSGVSGTFLITSKMRGGFLLCGLAGVCGFIVAALSMQFGFVVYNLLMVAIMLKGYIDWGREPVKIHAKE